MVMTAALSLAELVEGEGAALLADVDGDDAAGVVAFDVLAVLHAANAPARSTDAARLDRRFIGRLLVAGGLGRVRWR